MLISIFLTSFLAQAQDPFPDRVADARVTITHRLRVSELALPIEWGQLEAWTVLEGPSREPGRRWTRASQEREARLAMAPADWAAVAAGLAALPTPEAGTLPGDERLLLGWDPASFIVRADPAFHRNPPAAAVAQRELLGRYLLQQEIHDPKAVVASLEEVATLPPPASGQAEPPPHARWRVVDFPKGFFDPAGADPAHRVLGELAVDDPGGARFHDRQAQAGASVLVSAVSPRTGVRWFWFETAPPDPE